MPLAISLVEVLKREVKLQKITYNELARRVGISPASIKRMFTNKSMTLQRLDQILDATGIKLHDLTLMCYEESLLEELTYEQEEELINDQKKLIVAVSAMNFLTLKQITTIYNIEEAEAITYLIRLDQMGILKLMPKNRIKLLLSRTFRWIPNGPIQNFHRQESFADYLDAAFAGRYEQMQFISVMLSKQSSIHFLAKLKDLTRDIADQHQIDAVLPFEERHRMTFMLGARPWTPTSSKPYIRPEYIMQNEMRRKRKKKLPDTQ